MEAEEKREVEYLQEYWLEPVGDRYDQQAQADASIKEQYEMEQEEESLKKLKLRGRNTTKVLKRGLRGMRGLEREKRNKESVAKREQDNTA